MLQATPRPTIAHTRIVAAAISAWLARTQPKPEIVTERILIATETTVTRTVIAYEKRIG
jgi:hypothetical protein